MGKVYLLLSAVLLLLACSRWSPNLTRVVHLGDPALAFDAAQMTLQAGGYQIISQDEPRGVLQARAMIDAGEEGSTIHLQVYSDGSLRASLSGRLVKAEQNKVHRKLAAEVDQLMARIRANAHRLYESQAAREGSAGW